jgi:hypothetical protein
VTEPQTSQRPDPLCRLGLPGCVIHATTSVRVKDEVSGVVKRVPVCAHCRREAQR